MNAIKQDFNTTNLNKARLKEIVAKFAQARITIIGDLILDEYLLGTPERISREAPVIILKYLKSNFALGGAANAAAGCAALGAKTTLVGVIGKDAAAESFRDICETCGITLKAIIDEARGTTVKTRIISSSHKNPDAGSSQKQQVLRIDREDKSAIGDNLTKQILCKLDEALASTDIVLISDYGNGVLASPTCKAIINKCSDHNLKSIVDSTEDFNKFPGAYSLTPNQPDLEKNLSIRIEGDDSLAKAAHQLMNKLASQELLVTRGAKGMALFTKDTQFNIPALNLSEVFDVTGAGDTVAATYSLAHAVGASSYEAALLGNLAASIVVKKYGTATVSSSELIQLIDKV